jgi:hypothetical protein
LDENDAEVTMNNLQNKNNDLVTAQLHTEMLFLLPTQHFHLSKHLFVSTTSPPVNPPPNPPAACPKQPCSATDTG